MTDKQISLINPLRFTCPFCGQETITGETLNGECTVIHKWPMCSTFEQHGPIEYLKAANAALEKKEPTR